MALDERHRVHANSFGAVADVYERGRPQYPAEAIDWLVPPHATRVADVGAGTGKLTRQLHERGLDVVAVEPSAGMRGQLRRAVSGVPVLGGTGERIPLADHSVDAVLVAQAWHWVDPERAGQRWPGCWPPPADWACCGTAGSRTRGGLPN